MRHDPLIVSTFLEAIYICFPFYSLDCYPTICQKYFMLNNKRLRQLTNIKITARFAFISNSSYDA